MGSGRELTGGAWGWGRVCPGVGVGTVAPAALAPVEALAYLLSGCIVRDGWLTRTGRLGPGGMQLGGGLLSWPRPEFARVGHEKGRLNQVQVRGWAPPGAMNLPPRSVQPVMCSGRNLILPVCLGRQRWVWSEALRLSSSSRKPTATSNSAAISRCCSGTLSGQLWDVQSGAGGGWAGSGPTQRHPSSDGPTGWMGWSRPSVGRVGHTLCTLTVHGGQTASSSGCGLKLGPPV